MSKHPFEYQKPTDAQTATLSKLRAKAKELHDLILLELPHSRYRSMAITELESSSQWANKACVFDLADDGSNAPLVEDRAKRIEEARLASLEVQGGALEKLADR